MDTQGDTMFSQNKGRNWPQSYTRILLGAFLVLAVTMLWLVFGYPKFNSQEQVQGRLPEGMTADMVLEKEAANGQIFTKQILDGGTQSSLRYVSKTSAAEILGYYEKYFTENGWSIDLEREESEVSIISASKGNQQLIITSSRNSVTQDKIVDVTLLIKL